MYAKLFASLYQGTLRGCADEILVFTNLLAHADANGVVDKHWRAIAEECGVSRERVESAIAHLSAPDPESRSPEEEGRRIAPIDEHRAWGWRIVNHSKYRAIRNEDDRREQNRLAQERYRNRNGSKPRKPVSAQAEAEAEAEAEAKKEGKVDLPVDEAIQVFNDAARRCNWPVASKLTAKRKKLLQARLKDSGIAGWRDVIAKAEASEFLSGRSARSDEHKNWRLSIDFVLREGVFTNIQEGTYSRGSPKPRTPQQGGFNL